MSETVYVIRDPTGNPVALHTRTEIVDKNGMPDKKMSWLQPNGTAGLNGVGVKEMLYGLEMLAAYPDVTTVVLCEGEKSADALNRCGFLALATVCGASTVPEESVLRHLIGRRVILWPDNDPAPDPRWPDKYPQGIGQWHMDQIAAELARLGVEVNIATWPDAPLKGDAADLVEAGAITPEEVKAAVVLAPFQPPESPGNGDDPLGGDDGRPFKLTREETDPPMYVLHWPTMEDGRWTRVPGQRTLRVSPGAILRWGTVLVAWVTYQRGTPPWAPSTRDPWTTTLERLLDAMTDEDFVEPPPELTHVGRVRALLERLCGMSEPPDDPGDPRAQSSNLERGEPWWDLATGNVHFSFVALTKLHFSETAPGDRMKRPEIKQAIEKLGGVVSKAIDLPTDDRRRQKRTSWVPWKSFLGQ